MAVPWEEPGDDRWLPRNATDDSPYTEGVNTYGERPDWEGIYNLEPIEAVNAYGVVGLVMPIAILLVLNGFYIFTTNNQQVNRW